MKPSPHLYVAQIDPQQFEQLMKELQEQGFSFTKPPYTVFAAKKIGLSCTLYHSGKLVVQGKETQDFVTFYLEPQILKRFDYLYPDQQADNSLFPHIGGDETGKGDFLGPLVVAAVYANEEDIKKLAEMGVKDSKHLTDKTAIRLGSAIETHFVHQVVSIPPAKYNELYVKFGSNLNTLLAWAHATAIEKCVATSSCKHVIVDQFASEWVLQRAVSNKNLDIVLEQRTKGESDLVVAAASILARRHFLFGLETLERKYRTSFPKGGSSPKLLSAVRSFVAQYGKEELPNIAKMHFKTLLSV
ncbi:MAG: ribonuclease HIII [Chlamydiales bacterium]